MSTEISSACFALLDDCNATESEPRSRLYTGYSHTLACENPEQLAALLGRSERSGHHAVLLFSYELGAAMHQIAPRDGGTVAQILLFQQCQRMSADSVTQWLAEHADTMPAGIANIRSTIDADAFDHAISRIQDYIAAGDTYQVNFTYRLRFDAYGTPISLYRQLRARQPVPYGALIVLPDASAVLSHSPELFIRHTARHLKTQPMKGTASASDESALDTARAAALAADPKNRAENLMIIDLLRNDLSQVAALGSVAVPQLFEVARFGEVLQMTSTVTATLRDEASLVDIIAAVYPCGSITGAPKRRSMQIIRELETTARGIYTGALGWIDAPVTFHRSDTSHPPGDFCWSVPIRTLLLAAPDTSGVRQGEMGIGAGIVHDSIAVDEFAECELKARFLTGLPASFSLFETMAVSRQHGCILLERHLQRLAASALYFHFVFDEAALRDALRRTCDDLPDALTYRLRLRLAQNGLITIDTAPLLPLTTPVRLLIAPESMQAEDLFLRHKTTQRARYDQAWKIAEAQGAFDMLFFNQHGEVTEGARSNLFVQMDGRWYTPPLSAGVLPGVMRAQLLDDTTWQASERTLTIDQVRTADSIIVCNALRGVLPTRLA